MRVIAIANNKGGIGKTTSTVNIGASLALRGFSVMLIDLDPQANLSKSLGIREPDTTIYDNLTEETPLEGVPVAESLVLVPASLQLSRADMYMDPAQGDHFILKELISTLEEQFDYILIDCPPSLGILTTSALVAATELLLPVQAEFLSLEGVVTLMQSVEKIQKRFNPALKVSGVFVTRYDKRKVLNRNVAETLSQQFGERLLQTRVRDNVALAEAPAERVDIFRYAPQSHGAEDYHSLTAEILALANTEVRAASIPQKD